MKEKRYIDIETVRKASTDILKAIPKNEIKNSFHMLIDREKLFIDAKGGYFE